jgi:hypothetical protein
MGPSPDRTNTDAEEFIYRVKEAGEKPMDAIVSATSVCVE